MNVCCYRDCKFHAREQEDDCKLFYHSMLRIVFRIMAVIFRCTAVLGILLTFWAWNSNLGLPSVKKAPEVLCLWGLLFCCLVFGCQFSSYSTDRGKLPMEFAGGGVND